MKNLYLEVCLLMSREIIILTDNINIYTFCEQITFIHYTIKETPHQMFSPNIYKEKEQTGGSNDNV